MGSVWTPIRGTWWIWAIPIVVFTVTGGGIILLARAVPPGVDGSFQWMDRKTEMHLLGVFFIVFPALFSAGLALMLRRGARKADRLRSEGIPCRAIVLDAEPTGTTINDVPEYLVLLDVHPPDRPDFQTGLKVCVGMSALDSLRPGTEVRAWVEREDGPGLLVDFGGSMGVGPD